MRSFPRTVTGCRPSVFKVQESLGLTDYAFRIFKDCALRAHREYCARYYRSRWADDNVAWSSLPPGEIVDLVQMMFSLCISEHVMFPPTLTRPQINAGMEKRLQQVRRTWQSTVRSKKNKKMAEA
ncbi:hypothetical protein RBB50_011417 [Rhinocladiella similis]